MTSQCGKSPVANYCTLLRHKPPLELCPVLRRCSSVLRSRWHCKVHKDRRRSRSVRNESLWINNQGTHTFSKAIFRIFQYQTKMLQYQHLASFLKNFIPGTQCNAHQQNCHQRQTTNFNKQMDEFGFYILFQYFTCFFAKFNTFSRFSKPISQFNTFKTAWEPWTTIFTTRTINI